MRKRYTREQLMNYSNEEILEKTKDRAVDIHLYNGHWSQLCVNDLLGFDSENLSFKTRTGISIRLQDVDYIEVIG